MKATSEWLGDHRFESHNQHEKDKFFIQGRRSNGFNCTKMLHIRFHKIILWPNFLPCIIVVKETKLKVNVHTCIKGSNPVLFRLFGDIYIQAGKCTFIIIHSTLVKLELRYSACGQLYFKTCMLSKNPSLIWLRLELKSYFDLLKNKYLLQVSWQLVASNDHRNALKWTRNIIILGKHTKKILPEIM